MVSGKALKKPSISVVILTCNRKQSVVALVDALQKQTRIEDTEVIVVDNGSCDGTYEELSRCAAVDKVLRLEKNIGCAGRNRGIEAAASPYVVTLDDDVFPHRPDEIERILDFFDCNPHIHAVNFKILFPGTKEVIPFNWYHPRDFRSASAETFPTDYISEGAVAFRRACFEETGYYPEEFFLGHEGPDLACRFINRGYSIYYTGEVEVLHLCCKVHRTTWRDTYYETRNYLWYLIRNYPLPEMLPRWMFRLAVDFVFAVSRFQLLWYLRAVRDGLAGAPAQYRRRECLSNQARMTIRRIREGQPGALQRCFNFFRKITTMNEQHPTK